MQYFLYNAKLTFLGYYNGPFSLILAQEPKKGKIYYRADLNTG